MVLPYRVEHWRRFMAQTFHSLESRSMSSGTFTN